MGTEKKYHGWTNYETWCVHLWLSNDEASYHAAREAVEAALPDCDDCDGTGTRSSDGTEDLDCPTCGGSGKGKPDSDAADAIKELVENAIPDLSGSMAGDLLHAALSEVDWLEVAEDFAPLT